METGNKTQAKAFLFGAVIWGLLLMPSFPPAWGQQEESAVDSLLPVQTGVVGKRPSFADDEPERLSFRLQAGFSWESYRLSSGAAGALNLTLPATQGRFYAGQVRYQPRESIYSFRGKLRKSQTEFKGLGSVTPDSVTENRTDWSFAAFIQPFHDFASRVVSGVLVGVGYFRGARDVQETLNNAIRTKSTMSGLSLHLGVPSRLSEDFKLETDLSLGLVSSIQEEFQRTGFFGSGSIIEFEVGLSYQVSRWVEIAVVPRFRLERLKFDGTGARNATDAEEKETTIGVPFELRIKF